MNYDVFDDIYRSNYWSGEESRSGPGSGSAQRETIGAEIVRLVKQIEAQSVLDLGCGDGFWMPDVPGYVGVDVSSWAIHKHRERHPNRDIRLDDGGLLPTCDLAIMRCVLQHLSYADGLALIRRVLDAKPTWFAATTYTIDQGNKDIVRSGEGGFWVDMFQEPFSFQKADLLIDDTGASDEHGGKLAVWRLA